MDEDMRPRVPWMTKNDISLLEWLDSSEMACPPKQVWIYMDSGPTYQTVNRRLRKLEANGLVDKHSEANSYYQISEEGERFLHDPEAQVDDFLPDQMPYEPPEEDDEDEDDQE